MSFIHTCSRCGRKSVPGETGWIFGPGATCPECKTGCSVKGCKKPGTVTFRFCAGHVPVLYSTVVDNNDEPPPDAA